MPTPTYPVRYACYFDCKNWKCSVEIMNLSKYDAARCEVEVYDRTGYSPAPPLHCIWKDQFIPKQMYEVKHIDLNSVAAGKEGMVLVYPTKFVNDEFPSQLVIRGPGQNTVVNFMRMPLIE